MNEKAKVSEKKGKKNLFSEEVAQDQLDILTDFYDVDLEDEDDSGTKRIAKKRILRAIRQGRLTITAQDGVTVTQVLKNPPGRNFRHQLQNCYRRRPVTGGKNCR